MRCVALVIIIQEATYIIVPLDKSCRIMFLTLASKQVLKISTTCLPYEKKKKRKKQLLRMIAFSIQSSAPPTLNRDIHRRILREKPLSADKISSFRARRRWPRRQSTIPGILVLRLLNLEYSRFG